MLIFSKRIRLRNIIVGWCRENGVKANILTALSFLEAHDAIYETSVERIFEADAERQQNHTGRLP